MCYIFNYEKNFYTFKFSFYIEHLFIEKENMRKLTKEDFIRKSKEIHGDKYDYSKVEYVNSRSKVCIICPEHGEFYQLANSHLMGCGCNICGNKKISESLKKNKESFILKAIEVHGNKYDYSKVEYNGNNKKVCIICPEHGEFWQTPSHHINGAGCKKCFIEKNRKQRMIAIDEFIERANHIHNGKYDYSKVKYDGMNKKVCIICPEHGEFWQTPSCHINGKQGCPKCGNKRKNLNKTKTTEKFIKDAILVHGDKYDYSKVDYSNSKKKVIIICKKHGEFLQSPNLHLKGNGCPICNESVLERQISSLLTENNIEYIQYKRFKWLGKMSLDFFLPKHNIGIECQGFQHFYCSKNEKSFYTKEKIKDIKKRDVEKKRLCEENGIKLLYYSNLKIKYPYNVYTDKNNLLNDILNVQI